MVLNGVHTLGAAEANQTGHDGTFTEGEETKFNNKYYKMMLDDNTVWKQVEIAAVNRFNRLRR